MKPDENSMKKKDLHHLPEHKLINNGKKVNFITENEKKCREEEENSLLSTLPSQPESPAQDAHPTCSTKCPCKAPEEIRRELRAVKRQNTITHCLLSVMIILTAGWQISEVSLLLSAKEKLCNPLKTIGNLIRKLVIGRGKKFEIEGPPLPPIGVPQVPVVNLLAPSLSWNGDEC